jgi:hypothetical protein
MAMARSTTSRRSAIRGRHPWARQPGLLIVGDLFSGRHTLSLKLVKPPDVMQFLHHLVAGEFAPD